jgi:general secretion pathway protein D
MTMSRVKNLVSIGLVIAMTGIGSSFVMAQAELPPPPPPPPPPGAPVAPVAEPAPSDESPPIPDEAASSGPAPMAEAPSRGPKVSPKGPASDKKGATAIPAGQELVNMDFPEKTEIRDIVRAVALWTGKNVILDNNVSGKIQIISPRRVTKEEAYQAFLSALNVLRLTTVETGKILKIVPISTAVRGNLRTFLGSKYTPLTDEIITQIVPLKYVDAASIQTTLGKIVTANSMVAYQKTNTLIISDSGYKVRRILDILELIDVQGQQPQVQVVPILHGDAKTINDRVTEILKANSAGGGTFGTFKLIVDDRTNSVIVFGPPRTIVDIQSLIKKFDIPVNDQSRQASIHVRPLDYADAKKVASTLASLMAGGKKKAPSFSSPNIVGAPGASGGAIAELDDNVKITADESSNSLLITGSRSSFQSVNSILRKLDVRRSQVFVEADILDLSTSNGFNFATSIFGGAKAGQNPIVTTWQGKSMATVIASQTTAATPASSVAAAGAFAAEDMTIGILSAKTVDIPGIGKFSPGALIKMIKTDENTRVLSSPHIMTADNEEAKITVGEKVYFRSAEASTTGVQTSKVEREDVDLSLTLKPTISNSNYVTMKVDIDASSFGGLDSVSLLPKIKKRKTGQVLTVKNGQTVVISGLVQTQEFESFQKIPLLGDIPIIGWLFRNSKIGHSTSNMVIFLTPHVVHGSDDLAAIYQQKIKERDEYMEYIYGSSFKDDRFYSMLPKAEDGKYVPDAKDEDERKRREEVRSSYLNDSEVSATGGAVPAGTPSVVPMNATIGSGGGAPMGSAPMDNGPPGIDMPNPPPPPPMSPESMMQEPLPQPEEYIPPPAE